MFLFSITTLNVSNFIFNSPIRISQVATGLAERYKVLNKEMMNSTSKNRANWSEYRADYAALSCMVKKVDNDISPIIFLSFANNLYFICMQLLNSLS